MAQTLPNPARFSPPVALWCPYCREPAPEQLCPSCGRDTTAPRRICPTCQRIAPTIDAACWHCGAVFTSELWWKVPVIVLLFAIAFAISIALAAFG